jgi:hypothetical protein
MNLAYEFDWTWDRFTLDAEPRSLYMMSGASRQVWNTSRPCSRRGADGRGVLIPVQAAHHNEMMSPAVTE